ncbi:VENN motif pre-toxin domain-containing protein [Dickeya oryzae]|nr:VENN motif pre-toxin domain-containing protein [Dickeya oryzae]
MEALYPGKKPSELNEEQKQYISTLATIAGGLAAGVVGNTGADAVQGAQSAQVAVENNSLGLLARGCAVAAPCRTKVAEQLLEIGTKAGLAGLAGVALKEVADKMTSDELDHLITLQMMGNDEITGKYLSSLQDKYAPSHTGGDQLDSAGQSLTNTGGNQQLDPTGTPSHTGNNQPQGQGVTNTGNTDGAPSTAGNTTTTPIPDAPTLDDLFYRNEKIPGLENVRPENPGYPANQDVVNKMNDPKFIEWINNVHCTDCSDIAPKLLDTARGQGQIIEVRPKVLNGLNVYENGNTESNQSFHQVYTDGKYVYDPRLSLKPIPKGDWEKHIKSINPGGITISDKSQGLK